MDVNGKVVLAEDVNSFAISDTAIAGSISVGPAEVSETTDIQIQR